MPPSHTPQNLRARKFYPSLPNLCDSNWMKTCQLKRQIFFNKQGMMLRQSTRNS